MDTTETEKDAVNQPTPGSMLRNAREAMDLSVEQVAEKLHLLNSAVRYIESDTFDKLRGDTFVRGYLRNYARLVEINEEAVLSSYHLLTHKPAEDKPRGFFSRRRSTVDAAAKGAGRLGIVVALLALTLFMVFQNRKPVADTLQPATTEHAIEIDTRNGTRIVPLTPSPSTLTD